MVDLVGNEEDVAFPAEIEQLGLLFGLHHPAGRVAGRIHEQHPGPPAQRRAHVVHVEMPPGGRLPLAHEIHAGARHPAGALDVRPARADDDRVVAGAERHLDGDGEAEHGGTGHGDPVRVEVDPVERVEVALQRVAQVLPAAGVGVERVAVVERLLRGVADEFVGDEIPFAEPQRDHVGITEARQRDPSDPVLFQSGDFGAAGVHGGHR